jgi:hypothetical protein
MRTTRTILMGLVVSALSTLYAVDAFSWSHGPYVVTRPAYRQIYVGYPSYPTDTVCVYDADPWTYYGPVHSQAKPLRVLRRPFGHRHWYSGAH